MPAWPLVFIYMSDRKIRTLFVLREQMMISGAFVEAARLGDCCSTRFRGSRSASPVKIFWGLAGVCLFWAAIESVELLPLEFEGRHEVIDGFDLGIGKHRFVEGDSLLDVVIEPEEWRDGGHDRCPCWLGSDGPVSFVLYLEGGGAGEIGDGQINDDRLAIINSVCVGSSGGRTGDGSPTRSFF